MKKLLLILIVIAGATQLKAQQSATKPFDQNLFKTPKDQNLLQFKPDDSTLFKNFSTIPNKQLLALSPNKLSENLSLQNPSVNIDRMPIAKMNGNIDHMPIAKPSGNMEKMPVTKVAPLGLPKPVTP
ncbi:hypothetical protein [Mucilaginibacter sp. BT774]|uniref:hypothetical protein n=1 Tax=Mucilaginibacter sp. BT774 TaxID=3062276 RepID=UPI002675D670|nr:hypothetical protein [Mucilaginibacter sp. BT774]MDO3625675.1 hypothetical protein [Mucilaginibacter sp. BT774]